MIAPAPGPEIEPYGNQPPRQKPGTLDALKRLFRSKKDHGQPINTQGWHQLGGTPNKTNNSQLGSMSTITITGFLTRHPNAIAGMINRYYHLSTDGTG